MAVKHSESNLAHKALNILRLLVIQIWFINLKPALSLLSIYSRQRPQLKRE